MTTLPTFARLLATNLVLTAQRTVTNIVIAAATFLAGYGVGRGRHPTPVNTALLVFVVIAIACLIAASLIATFVQVAKARRS